MSVALASDAENLVATKDWPQLFRTLLLRKMWPAVVKIGWKLINSKYHDSMLDMSMVVAYIALRQFAEASQHLEVVRQRQTWLNQPTDIPIVSELLAATGEADQSADYMKKLVASAWNTLLASLATMDDMHAMWGDARLVSQVLSKEQAVVPTHGLANGGNACYLNTVMQVMMGCTMLRQFCEHLESLLAVLTPERAPVCYGLAHLARAYNAPAGQVPTMAIPQMSAVVEMFFRGEAQEQQDAQELMIRVLSAAHEEIVNTKQRYPELSPMPDDSSFLDSIFSGRWRVTSERSGSAPSTDTTPFKFLTLILKPDSVQSLATALKFWSLPSVSYDNQGVLKQTFKMAAEPELLVFHLLRFCQAADGTISKEAKAISFPDPLVLEQDLLVAQCVPADRTYRLVATINHHGDSVHNGHYTAYVRHADGVQWVHANDTVVSYTGWADVQQQTRSVYMLFYQRTN